MTFDALEYPFVFFPVGLNLAGRRCVVIGDDREAEEKDEALRLVRAEVVRLRDAASVTEDDVAGAFFVVYTPQESEGAARMRAWADRHKFLLCAIDQPAFGFVAMQATATAGPVRIAISTGGIAPRVGGRIRAGLQSVMDAKFERFIACLSAQRERNKRRIADGGERRREMIARAEGFELDVTVRYPEWFESSLAPGGPEVLPSVARAVTASAQALVTPKTPRERALSYAIGAVFTAVVIRELTRK